MQSQLERWLWDYTASPLNLVGTAVLAALVQSLNSVAALTLVYAFRYGRAIIVSPLGIDNGPQCSDMGNPVQAWARRRPSWDLVRRAPPAQRVAAPPG